MAGTVFLQVHGIEELIASFAKMPDTVKETIGSSLKNALDDTISDVISSSGKGYISRSGSLDKSMYSTVDDSGTEGTITLSKTVSNAPYALAQHEGANIHQIATGKQAFFLSKKFGTWILPGTEINITLKPLKFLYRVWESDITAKKIAIAFGKGIQLAIKKVGL